MANADQLSSMDQIVRASFDSSAQALKTVSQSTSQITISAEDDSIEAYPVAFTAEDTSVDNTTADFALPATACQGVSSVMIYAKTLTTITDAQVLTLELSPTSTGDVWFTTAVTLTPSTTANDVVATAVSNIRALRLRVKTAAAITSGTYAIYVVGQ